MRKVATFIFSLTLIFSLASSLQSFDNNKENYDRVRGEFIPYTVENVSSGKLKGGHDTLTVEGMLLKEMVHKQTDPDGGTNFRNKMVREALPHLRTGAHDEDTSKLFNFYLQDPPIGPNGWGDFFQHFYNPETGKGFKGTFGSAPDRAVNYFIEILKKVGCGPNAINNISENDKKKIYDYFGRILHLLQDMGNPAHTRDDLHVFTKTFEDYVRDHWSEIVNSENFKEEVTPEKYLQGNYGNLPNTYYSVFYPEEFIKTLAEISKNYYTDGLGEMTDDQVKANTSRLIPETIKYTAGYINAIYQMMSGGIPNLEGFDCNRPPDPPSPANDHPDDRFDVSDEFYWEKEFGLSELDLTNFLLRVGIKKGKVGLWYKKRFMELFINGRTKYKDASQEIKNAIESEFHAMGRKLEERRGQAESEWKGAPDIALFTNGFYKPSISLMLKIGEPVSFQNIDFDPQIVRDHPVMLIPTGGFYGLKNSNMVKALLEEYVKNGGILVALTQQLGRDWGLLPTPIDPDVGERKPVTGYGYQEDQSCQYNSVYIDTYHPMLSVFSTFTGNIGVDGYFTSYPENSTVLLRRVSNGQPAMIMYPFGKGHVIATTLYTDFALTHHQANQTEINFIQNIISWAKKPQELMDVRPGEIVNLNLDVTNFTDVDTTSIKITILDPSRKIVNEMTQNISIGANQSLTIPFTYTSSITSTLGIYHIDYTLLDAQGNIIQPQAETDSGRFALSKPPKTKAQIDRITFSIQSDAEHYVLGDAVTFTILAFNSSDVEKTITAKFGGQSRVLTVPAKGTSSFVYLKTAQSDYYHWGQWWGMEWVSFYEETKMIGASMKLYRVYPKSADFSIQTDKILYKRGETITINASIKNNIPLSWQTTVKIAGWGSPMGRIFEEIKTVVLPASGTILITTRFTLSSMISVGTLSISVALENDTRLAHTNIEIVERSE